MRKKKAPKKYAAAPPLPVGPTLGYALLQLSSFRARYPVLRTVMVYRFRTKLHMINPVVLMLEQEATMPVLNFLIMTRQNTYIFS
jgi:hypothetical protein